MAGRASDVKMGDDGGGLLISPDGEASCRMVSVSASVIFPYSIKVQNKAVKWLCLCVCLCIGYVFPAVVD